MGIFFLMKIYDVGKYTLHTTYSYREVRVIGYTS